MDGDIVALAVAFVFGWPVWITALIVRHREKMRQMELKQQQGSPAVAEEISALRRELAQLRETTTRFDMSFDASLDRLERRMDRTAQNDSARDEVYPRPHDTEPVEAPLRRY